MYYNRAALAFIQSASTLLHFQLVHSAFLVFSFVTQNLCECVCVEKSIVYDSRSTNFEYGFLYKELEDNIFIGRSRVASTFSQPATTQKKIVCKIKLHVTNNIKHHPASI